MNDSEYYYVTEYYIQRGTKSCSLMVLKIKSHENRNFKNYKQNHPEWKKYEIE